MLGLERNSGSDGSTDEITSPKRRRVERVLLIHQAPRCGIASCFASITNPARILEQFCSCLTLAFSFSSYRIWHLLGVGQLVAVVSVRRRNYQHRRSNASAQNLPNNSKQKPSIKNWQKKGFLARETVFKP